MNKPTGEDISFTERLAYLDTVDRDPGVICPPIMLAAQGARLVIDAIRAGVVDSPADFEQILRARQSRVYLVAGEPVRGATVGTINSSLFTLLVQDPTTMPEHSLQFKLQDDPAIPPTYPGGVSYDENFARLESTGVIIDTANLE